MANDVRGAKKPFDREKFNALVHYIIWKCPDPAKLGSVKLHKILWKSDTSHYVSEGEPITGAKYVKRQYGPATNALLRAREELQAEGAIKFWRDSKFAGDYAKDVYEAVHPASEGLLTKEERRIVDHWVQHICLEHTAESISDATHDYAWEIAEMGEELPIYAVFAERVREPNEKELSWARKVAERLGLK